MNDYSEVRLFSVKIEAVDDKHQIKYLNGANFAFIKPTEAEGFDEYINELKEEYKKRLYEVVDKAVDKLFEESK